MAIYTTFYTTFLEPEDRPNLLNRFNVYAVVDDVSERVMAYCLDSHSAEFVKLALVYAHDHMHDFYRSVKEREASTTDGGTAAGEGTQ